MPQKDDYRLYLNERFDHLTHLVNAQFTNVNERLDAIEEQTKLTNGRVNELEKWKDTCEGERTGRDKQLGLWLKIGAFVISITMAYIAYSNMTTKENVQILEKKLDWATSPFNPRGLELKDSIK
jgi:tetrahydromethanopterin S-methyltransferase subunit G